MICNKVAIYYISGLIVVSGDVAETRSDVPAGPVISVASAKVRETVLLNPQQETAE